MIKEFKNKIFDKALKEGFSDCEIYYNCGKSFKVKIFGGELDEYQNSDSIGVSFRGTYNGKIGYAFSEKLNFDVIDTMINNAKQNSEIIEIKEKEFLYKGDTSYPEVISYSESLNNVSVEQKIEFAKLMEKTAYNLDKRVKSVDNCVLATGESTVYLANSLGLELSDRSNYALAYIAPRVEENEQVKLAYDIWLGKDFKDFSPTELAKGAVDKAVSYLGAKSAKTGKYSIIFDNNTTCDILSVFLDIFFAETVQKGFSLLKGKLGQKIASEKLTIFDNGILAEAICSSAFDSEGVAVKNKVVIEDGILKTYLYNLKSATKDNTDSTGNGFRGSFKSSISTAATNFYIKPSSISKENLTKNMQNGIIITELAGLHSGANTISGDFSLSADGYLVENGEIVRAVEQITIAGNFFEMLQNIIDVADDLKFSIPSSDGNIGAPSILVSELNVTGM